MMWNILMLKQKKQDAASLWIKFFLSFSVFSNWKAVMSTNAGGRDNLTCLHGMRFISMTWVVLGHSFVFNALYSNVQNPLLLGEIFAGKLGFAFEAVLNAPPSVDSFFLLRKLLANF